MLMIKQLKLKQSFFIALWFVFLTFPIMAIRVNTIEKVVEWRWKNMLYVGLGSFIFSFVWRYFLERREAAEKRAATGEADIKPFSQRIIEDPAIYRPVLAVVALFLLGSPFVLPTYHTNVMTTDLMYIVLGLGLNIIVGL